MIEQAIAEWGYIAIALGVFLEGEAVVVSAGALAHRGVLSLPLVVLFATAGSLVWTQGFYQVGRRTGRSAMLAKTRWHERLTRVERAISRFGGAFVLVSRFAYGLGTATPALFGVIAYPRGRFLALDLVGALTWSTAVALAGFGLSAAVSRWVVQASLPTLLGAALLGALLLWLVIFSLALAVRRDPASAEPR